MSEERLQLLALGMIELTDLTLKELKVVEMLVQEMVFDKLDEWEVSFV